MYRTTMLQPCDFANTSFPHRSKFESVFIVISATLLYALSKSHHYISTFDLAVEFISDTQAIWVLEPCAIGLTQCSNLGVIL